MKYKMICKESFEDLYNMDAEEQVVVSMFGFDVIEEVIILREIQ